MAMPVVKKKTIRVTLLLAGASIAYKEVTAGLSPTERGPGRTFVVVVVVPPTTQHPIP